ncbi:MAG TPA: DUF58 domain-containing protein [Polyangiaceae bacterium]|nr:DUF58 domain-containing protein [Polyangiaceae bacterium]
MQLYPTRSTFHVAVAGAGLVALGCAARLAPVTSFGGAMLLAVALGRAIALLSVTRLRAAGFEMVWTGPTRVRRASRDQPIVLEGELRNRGNAHVRAVGLRPLASSMLEASVEPASLDLPPGARARVDVTVVPKRIGRWGVHGLALEVRGTSFGGENLYEVPLLFANPLGVEVLPRALAAVGPTRRGGLARRAAEDGQRANLAGEHHELRELRDHSPGDPFKRIAWKASARRGRLLVRETERQERDIVWLVLDASVELWAGAAGTAPLDLMTDQVAAMALRHLRRRERVGLVVVGSRVRTWIPPGTGAAHAAVLGGALASAASAVDTDRSELEETDVARRVAEHARPLDPHSLRGIRKNDLDALARRADQLRPLAPFAPRVPFAPTVRERSLRQYMAAFGIESPPRSEGERDRAEAAIAAVLERLATTKPRASSLHIWAPAPSKVESTVDGMIDGVAKAIAGLRSRRVVLRWSLPPFEAGVGAERIRRSAVADVVDEAVRIRARATRTRGEKLLRKLGVQVVAGETPVAPPPVEAEREEPPGQEPRVEAP